MSHRPYPFVKRKGHGVNTAIGARIQTILSNAVRYQQAGRLTEAAGLYRQILSLDARHADGLHLLGMVEYQLGHRDAAVEMIHAAIGIKGNEPSYYSNLGTVLQAQGKLDEAKEAYEKAVALKPAYAEAHINLGTLLQAQGRVDAAVECYQRALAIKPNSLEACVNLGSAFHAQYKLDEAVVFHQRALCIKSNCAEAHYNLGNTFLLQGKLDEAAASYQKCIEAKPGYAEAYGNLGTIFQEQGKLEEARVSYEKALLLKPRYAEIYTNLGNVHHAEGRIEDAVAAHERALTLKPQLAEAYYNWGNALVSQGKPQEALGRYESALSLKPNYAEVHCNWGCALYALGDAKGAVTHYRRALALKPDYAKARFCESLSQLVSGEFGLGWQNYEARWQTKDHDTKMRAYAQPFWNGERLESGRLLIWGEQGIGDEIMFSGLIPEVTRTGNSCILDCDARLRPLFSRSFPDVEVISSRGSAGTANDQEIDFVAHLPSGSLPRLFRKDRAAFESAKGSYLVANSLERDRFRSRYSNGRRLIGLAWYTKNAKTGRSRSIDLSSLKPLFDCPGIQWVSLQYGDWDRLEAEANSAGAPLLIDRSVNQLLDIDRFAAQTAAMDLVITIDNSTAHLAGALGVPCWLFLPFAADWRWFQAQSDSPWYPSLRLFRQPQFGDWQSVIRTVSSLLATSVSAA